MPRRRLPPRSLRLASVAIPALPAGGEKPNPDWIQIAAEGDYKGYAGGTQPFRLDAAVFAVIVRNFRAHPSYVAAGGPTDVVAYDFSHASEVDPSEIAVEGAPAQAWAQELEIREGAMGVELWALTRFLPRMVGYRAEGSYKWTSVCVWPDQVDPVSGEKIGWTLSSIAFTNDPFIQGMVPFAASRSFAGPGEVLEVLRSLFEIPAMSPPDEILAALAKLRSYARNPPSAPVGVDVNCLVGELRQIFNLPTLAGVDEIFAQADALIVALAEAPPVSTISATRKDLDDMDHFQTACIALAAKLRCKLPEKPEQTAAFLCEAVDGATETATSPLKTAGTQLEAVLGALGEQDVPGAMKRIADMFKQCAELEAALPALKAYRELEAKTEGESVEEDVAMAMSHHFAGQTKIAELAKPALLHMRKTDKAGFAAKYPRPTAETKTLTANLTGGGSIIASASHSVAGGVPMLPNGTAPTIALLNAQPGGNPNAKAIALVRANGGEKLSHDQAFTLGVTIVRRLGGAANGAAPASI